MSKTFETNLGNYINFQLYIVFYDILKKFDLWLALQGKSQLTRELQELNFINKNKV